MFKKALHSEKLKNNENLEKNVLKHKFKKCAKSAVFLLSLFPLFSCAKNTDGYLQSKYFQTPESNLVETVKGQENSSQQLLAGQVLKAVVALECKVGGLTSLGSGVCVKSGGYIITNEHVVSGASAITVYGYNNQKASAIVLWSDEVQDIAILKSDFAFDYLELYGGDSVQIGQQILAVGTPLSLNFLHTCTSGIVSAVNRTLSVTTTSGTGYMQDLIQHDASINSGNSGGPLINNDGMVVGINTLKISTAEGLGFAIPSKAILSLLNNLSVNSAYKTPYLGVYGYNNSLNYAVTSNDTGGFYVEDIAKNSPAYSALQKGDVITSVNGASVFNATDLRAVLYSLQVTDEMRISLNRNGEDINVSLKVVSSPVHANSIGAIS